jgi:hypothetical protein
MSTQQQKRQGKIIGFMMIAGIIIGAVGGAIADNIPNWLVWVMCGGGFGSFFAGCGALIAASK